MKNSTLNNPLVPSVLLCGYERGGTTLLSEILISNGYESGFECGVLMCDSPNDFLNFKPYADLVKSWWSIPKDISSFITKEQNFEAFYHEIITQSGLSKNTDKFFDKTPIYMKELGRCLCRAPFIEKAIVITRDPRSIFNSWAKREVQSTDLDIESIILKNIDAYVARYIKYFIGAISERSNQKVLFISFEQLCLSEQNVCQIIGHFLENRTFKTMNNSPRFKNVYSNKILLDKVDEYKNSLSEHTQILILERCAIAALFFGSNHERLQYMNQYLDLDFNIQLILSQFNLQAETTFIEGRLFNPWRYLYYNQDVLTSGINPLTHFLQRGFAENRQY